MANYPIKILIDEQGKEFVPFVNTDVVYFPDGSTLSNALDTKADKTTMASELDKKADKATTLEGYGISDAYTKTQIDEKLASVYDYRGSVDTKADLLAITGQKKGDVWNVLTDESTITEDHPEPETGVNYAWDGKAWDKLGMTIDLSAYETKENAKAYLTTNNIKAGENVQIAKSGNDNTFDIKIADNLTTNDSHAALSAEQGRIINENLMKPLANGQTNQVLAKVSDSSYDMAWVKAADPNSIIGDGSIVKMVEISYDDYLALQEAGQVDPDVEYHIPDADGQIVTMDYSIITSDIATAISNHEQSRNHPLATTKTNENGLMSWQDKIKLDSVEANAVSKETVLNEISSATTTFVSETDIDNKISTAVQDFISEEAIDEKISEATSEFMTESDFNNKTINFVDTTEANVLINNAIADFATTDTIPTKTSQLTNDSGFITVDDIPEVDVPTKTSELTNDSGFITTDNNTTYTISKSGNTVTLTGSDGSTSTFTDANTTYSNATTSQAGLMSAADKTKLNAAPSTWTLSGTTLTIS